MYNYIFFKGYQLAKKLKNWQDTPVLFSTMGLAVCFIMHLATVLMFAEAASRNEIQFSQAISFMNRVRFFVGAAVVIMFYFYYATNGRGEKIFNRLQKNMDNNLLLRVNPFLALLSIFVISFCVCVLAAMYKNGDGIFG